MMASLALAAGLRLRPSAVLKLIDQVASIPLGALPRSARDVLVYLASLVDARNPDRPVWPKRETIARNTGLSEPTVYRALGALEKEGFIAREPQAQADDGIFGSAPIRLTSKVLMAPDTGSEPPCVPHGSERANETDAPQRPCVPCDTRSTSEPSTDLRYSSAQQPLADAPATTPTVTVIDGLYVDQDSKEESNGLAPRPLPERRRTGLPEALQWLERDGYLEHQQVLSLLALAKRSKVWLQDVLAAKREAIATNATLIKNLYTYLRYLITSGTDWRQKAKLLEASSRECEAVVRERTELAEAIARHAGREYRHNDGRRFRVTDNGVIYQSGADGRLLGAAPMTAAFDEAVAEGRIVPAVAP